MNVPDVFQRITTALNQSHIPYMLTGSFAASFYSAPRTTQNIDLVVDPTEEQLRTLVQQLPSSEYYVDLDAALEARKQRSLFNIVDMSSGWKIDLIIRKSRPFSSQEFSRRTQSTFQGITLFIVSPEDAILSKLEWAKHAESQRQVEDVAAMLKIRWDSLDRAYLEKWVTELEVQEQWSSAKRLANVQT